MCEFQNYVHHILHWHLNFRTIKCSSGHNSVDNGCWISCYNNLNIKRESKNFQWNKLDCLRPTQIYIDLHVGTCRSWTVKKSPPLLLGKRSFWMVCSNVLNTQCESWISNRKTQLLSLTEKIRNVGLCNRLAHDQTRETFWALVLSRSS